MSSLTDSNAETTNRQPASASAGHSGASRRMCSTFVVQSKVSSGKRSCIACATRSEWRRPLRKSGSPRVMWGGAHPPRSPGSTPPVACAQPDEPRYVPHHGVCADDPDAPVVDGGHRAVAALVHAAVTRLDVAHE